MSRPLRIEFPGAFYHVTSRGNEKKAIFRSNRDREHFLSYLESAHHRYGAVFHVYCLMNNHYHLLIETPRGNLSQILHHINGAYTTYFNIRYARSGHLFQGRFKAILAEKQSYSEELSRYIHLNPVRAGLVEDPSDYPWSSYRYYIGKEKEPEWLTTTFILGDFKDSGHSTYRRYREFVEEGISKPLGNPFKKVVASTFLGGEEFIQKIKEKYLYGKNIDQRNVPSIKALLRGPTPAEIETIVAKVINGNMSNYMKWCIYLSHQWSGWRLAEIGAYFGLKAATVSQVSRRFRKLLENNKDMKTLLNHIKKEWQNTP